MHLPKPKCEIREDGPTLERYSTDMSRYHVKPMMIVTPRTEQDILEIIEYARSIGAPITARAAGSNLSGNAIGRGIIVLFNGMDRLLSENDSRVWVEPGLVYDRLNEIMKDKGFFLPYHVSSSKYCSVGGNVATRASGLRSIKYGTVDTSVRNIRFASPVFGMVDTSKGLPEALAKGIIGIKERLLSDKDAMEVLRSKEHLKTSMGYNLWSFNKYDDPAEIVAHLMVGSVGTLGLMTGIELELRPIPAKRVMLVAFFDSLPTASRVVASISLLHPSLLEVMDAFGTDMLRSSSAVPVPDDASATLMIEFDSDWKEGEAGALKVLGDHALSSRVLQDPKEQETIWGLRWKMLLEIKRRNETAEKRYLSFVDDLGVPVENIHPFVIELESIFIEEGVPVIIYGHIGEGNLHVRPLIGKEHWKEDLHRIGDRCFKAVFRYNGTVAAEHGAGRNRAALMKEEWGEAVYGHFLAVKMLFDPENILNPDVIFSDADITEGLDF
ncbi:MAG: FAD-binding oxidoreductase [Candidatus Thermoplasmatota archaeon]|jgi:FAD/FMN-containing dehydrogenase|nr:FAD-binding oxidoreductase [Candidatus Thermoplasmatota archaeon]